jgi:photosystem II stability/assembly factor-like uncharacterized protein
MKTNFIKKIFFFLIFCSVLIHAQWYNTSQNLPAWDAAGWQLDACSNNDVIIAVTIQDYSLYKTTNGGNSWTGLTLPAGIFFDDISYIDQQHLWGVSADSSEIWFSSNGGTSWTMQKNFQTSTSFMNYIKMFDTSNGIVMGDAIDENHPFLLARTTNGGVDWESVNDSLTGVSGDLWSRINFVNMQVGYFYNSTTDKLYKTTTGGTSWNELTVNIPVSGIELLKFYNENYGFLYIIDYSPAPNYLLRTTDGGENWEQYDINASAWPNDIEFLPGDPSKIWFATLKELFFSSDSGKTWQEDPLSNTFSYGRALKFTDSLHGWFLAENVYKDTTSDRITDIKESVNPLPQKFQLYQNYPNPFNPVTKIKYFIAENTQVLLKVYNVLGMEIKSLIDKYQSAGEYTTEFDGNDLPSGVYLYKMTAGNYTAVKKMILIK